MLKKNSRRNGVQQYVLFLRRNLIAKKIRSKRGKWATQYANEIYTFVRVINTTTPVSCTGKEEDTECAACLISPDGDVSNIHNISSWTDNQLPGENPRRLGYSTLCYIGYILLSSSILIPEQPRSYPHVMDLISSRRTERRV